MHSSLFSLSSSNPNSQLQGSTSHPPKRRLNTPLARLQPLIKSQSPMEDDDEFGDLYADIFQPISIPQPPPPIANPPVPNPTPKSNLLSDDDDQILSGAPPSAPPASSPPQPHPSTAGVDDDGDWLLGPSTAAAEEPHIWDDDDGGPVPAAHPPAPDEPRVLEDAPTAAIDVPAAHATDGIELDDPYEEPVIPGLSSAPQVLAPTNPGDARATVSEDWDSDSEDDLQIVLNDNNPVLAAGGEGNVGAGSDDEDDLVIVMDTDQPIHHQATEEQDWGEEGAQPAAEGERKEISEVGKGSGAVANAPGLRISFGNSGVHPQHHYTYNKYVRPGAGPAPGGPIAGVTTVPGQIRPPTSLGPITGRGRGDWRPAGGRGIPNAQRSINPGYMPPSWANNSLGRGFGNGMDFILPSHKTIFDIDIESFDDKPWRHPGVNISDYFNFGLDEDNWKDYCKQLEQIRMEATMQSKIRVYESGRSEQDYDPELPPELAAAAGHRDISADNPHDNKVENGQADLSGPGRGPGSIQPALPIGRAIQVEGSYCERQPSIDTRPPRLRDSDAIIEIVLQNSLDDSKTSNGALEKSDKVLQGGDRKGVHSFEEDDRQGESEYVDQSPHASNRRRGAAIKKVPYATEDVIRPFPPDLPHQHHPNSRTRNYVNTSGPFGTPHGGRFSQGTSRGRHSNMSKDPSVDPVSSRNAPVNRRDSHQIVKPAVNMEPKQTSEASPGLAVSTPRELSLEERDSDHSDRLALGDSFEAEGEDTASDFRMSDETPADEGIALSAGKQKLSSRIEQPAIEDNGDAIDLRVTHSDNSRARSGGAKDYRKHREGGEEVMQDGRSRRVGDLRKRREEEDRSRRKDDYGRDARHETDRNHIASKARDPTFHSYPKREWDSTSAHHARGRSEGFERTKEMDPRQKRDDDLLSRRVKDEDTRREQFEETGSRNRNKLKIGGRNDKDDDAHMKKRVDDGDWRGRHRGGPRQRDDPLMKRRENMDDPAKRKKDEEHARREKSDKEEPLHSHRLREDSGRRKRERDDGVDHKREDDRRMREKTEDHNSTKHKADSGRQREREDMQRLKPPHEDPLTHREREEGRAAVATVRNGRTTEDKSVARNGKSKDDSRGLSSDKDSHHRERKRDNELFRRVDRTGEGSGSQSRRDDVRLREKHSSNERSSRHERMSGHNDRPSNVSVGQQMHKGKIRENTRKSHDIEVGTQNHQGSGKRKHEDHDAHQNEKVGLIGTRERETNGPATHSKIGHHHFTGELEAPQMLHSSGEVGDEPSSDDEKNQRGRSKLERWTSQKERDYSAVDDTQPLLSSSIAKEVEGSITEIIESDECAKVEISNANHSDGKGVDTGQITDKMGDDQDHHLDTVAKLKRRSERFKLPMPGEKDTVLSKKVENEVPLTQNEATTDMEIKPERPARKRRWTGS